MSDSNETLAHVCCTPFCYTHNFHAHTHSVTSAVLIYNDHVRRVFTIWNVHGVKHAATAFFFLRINSGRERVSARYREVGEKVLAWIESIRTEKPHMKSNVMLNTNPTHTEVPCQVIEKFIDLENAAHFLLPLRLIKCCGCSCDIAFLLLLPFVLYFVSSW